MAKVSTTQVTTLVDGDGIIQEERKTQVFAWGQEPDYIKLYIADFFKINGIQKCLNPILICLLRRTSWAKDGQILYVNAGLKEEIAEELNLSIDRINHAISQLAKSKILLRKRTGTYQINPYYFGRGDWSDIAKIRMTITYDANGRTIENEVIHDKRKKKKVPLSIVK